MKNHNRGHKGQNRVPSSPATSVGSTVATSMGFSLSENRSVHQSVLKVRDMACHGPRTFSSSCRKIVEGYAWCFIARRSNRRVMFTPREFQRFVESLRRTANRVEDLVGPEFREQTFCKFWTDSYLAKVVGDTLPGPPPPDWMPGSLFVGWCRRFVARAISRRDVSFIYSLQKGAKQIWEQQGPRCLVHAMRDTKLRLCNPRGSSSLSDHLQSRLTAFAKTVFGSIPTGIPGNRFMPSSSACLQRSVREHGALGLYEPLHLPTNGERSVLGPLRDLVREVDSWRQRTWEYSLRRVNHDISEGLPPHGNLGLGLFDTRYCPIYEPGKIRNVSVADGYLATVLQPLQGGMLSAWKRTEWSTMLDDDLTPRVQLMDEGLSEPLFISGDYRAATDLLFRGASTACFSGVPSTHPLFELGYLSLIGGSMYFPAVVDGKEVLEEAETLGIFEGQLMGHTLSFPLLCTINAFVLRESLQEWILDGLEKGGPDLMRDRRSRSIRISRLACINGDDILFKGDADLVTCFRRVSASLGLEVSVGKNYVSPDCCLINSQMFRRVSGKMRRFGYLNLRLLTGINVKTGRESSAIDSVLPMAIAREASKMVDLCPWTLSTVPTILNRWYTDRKSDSWFQPNWFLPVHLGGYGFPLRHASSSFRITRGQRIVAAMFVSNPRLSLYRLTGMPVPPRRQRLIGVLNPFWVQGEGPMPAHLSVLAYGDWSDPWMERIMYANRASLAGDQQWRSDGGRPLDGVELVRLATRFRRQWRLRPMSARGITSHWHDRLVAYLPPECPPLGNIRSVG